MVWCLSTCQGCVDKAGFESRRQQSGARKSHFDRLLHAGSHDRTLRAGCRQRLVLVAVLAECFIENFLEAVADAPERIEWTTAAEDAFREVLERVTR